MANTSELLLLHIQDLITYPDGCSNYSLWVHICGCQTKSKAVWKCLKLPGNSEREKHLNFIFLGDDGFGAHEYMLELFPYIHLTCKKEIDGNKCCGKCFCNDTKMILYFTYLCEYCFWKSDLSVVLTACLLHKFRGSVVSVACAAQHLIQKTVHVK